MRGLPAAERLVARQSRSRPLLASLQEWSEENSTTLSKKSRLGEAFAGAQNRWGPVPIQAMVWQSLIITQASELFVPSVLGKRILTSSAAGMVESEEPGGNGRIGTCRPNGI